MFYCLLFFSQMPTRTSILLYFSFIQQFLLWYLLPCLLTLLLWPKFMSFPIWSAWKRHVHMNMEPAVWAASPWGCDTHIPWRITSLSFSWIWPDIQLHRAHHCLAWAVVSCFSIKLVSLILSFFPPNIRLSQKMLLITFSLIGGEIVQAECGWRAMQSRIFHFHVIVSLGTPLKHPSQLSTHTSIRLLLQRFIVQWVESWELHPWKCNGRCPPTNENSGGRRTVLRD